MSKRESIVPVVLSNLKRIWEEDMPFNKFLGVKLVSLDIGDVCVRIDMKEELVGNSARGILHGGVISSVLDLTGGVTAMTEILKQMSGRSIEEIANRCTKAGTIDLRVDYLRPGEGQYFLARASILHAGRRLAVARSEFRNDSDLLIAVGMGTYMIGA